MVHAADSAAAEQKKLTKRAANAGHASNFSKTCMRSQCDIDHSDVADRAAVASAPLEMPLASISLFVRSPDSE